MTVKANKTELRALLARAHEAGHRAATTVVPNPMIVRKDSITVNGVPALDRDYFVSEGACGFAWVVVKPGTSALAKLMKAEHGARIRGWGGGGMELWVGDYGQSVTRKAAYADAYAKVLTDAGYRAYPGSRLD